MSFLSGLKVFGHKIETIFSWMGSPAGQTVISAGEAVVETVAPNSIPLVNLVNAWMQKAFTVEALAVAAGQSSGTGADKAALVMQSITPQVLTYAQQSGMAPRTASQIQAANDGLITIIKALTDPAPPPTA